jgi:hypothetical protein
MMALVDRRAHDERIELRQVKTRGPLVETAHAHAQALTAHDVSDALGDLGRVAVVAGVQDEDALAHDEQARSRRLRHHPVRAAARVSSAPLARPWGRELPFALFGRTASTE